MATYVISDVHGHLEVLISLLKKVDFKSTDTLYVLGDVIDKGKQSIDALLFIMEQPNIHMLMGNHEAMFLDCLDNPHEIEKRFLYYLNGGAPTYDKFLTLPDNKQKQIIDYLKSLPLYHLHGKFFLSHSGVNMEKLDLSLPLEEALAQLDRDDFLWNKEIFCKSEGIPNVITILGYNPTIFICDDFGYQPQKYSIWFDKKFNNKIGIDCGVIDAENGRLALLSLDDLSIFYS